MIRYCRLEVFFYLHCDTLGEQRTRLVPARTELFLGKNGISDKGAIALAVGVPLYFLSRRFQWGTRAAGTPDTDP